MSLVTRFTIARHSSCQIDTVQRQSPRAAVSDDCLQCAQVSTVSSPQEPPQQAAALMECEVTCTIQPVILLIQRDVQWLKARGGCG